MFKTSIAYENWNRKYRYGDESEIQTWERVARALASVETEPDKWYPKFLNALVKFDKDKKPFGLKCTPGGRITANIGTGYKGATTINCFINGPVSNAHLKYTRKSSDGSVSYPVEYKTPDTPDDLVNIFLTIMEQAKTLASEGGYGINMDWIRPRGALIKGTGIKHPGVIAYLKVWDSVAECIVKGDQDGYVDKIKNYLGDEKFEELKKDVKKETRKGAMMVVLSCSHPDAEEFIRAKQTSGVLTKFNMSVLMDDDFMKAVEKDDFYEQKFNDKIYKRIKARDLYNLVMESCYNRAEPGVLFYDNMQKNNPISYLGDINACNPCLDGSSYLLTKNFGLKKIRDISGCHIEIWNGKEWSFSQITETGIKPVYLVKMSNGLQLRATEDHLVSIDGSEVMVKDSLNKTIERINGSYWDGVPIELSDLEIITLGFAFGNANYYIKEGCFRDIYIGGDDPDIEVLFNNIGESLGDCGGYKRALSPSFNKKCSEIGIPEAVSPERQLSDRIRSLPPRQMGLFLKGLFSANGFVHNRYDIISLKISCNELAHQVQVLLSCFGIRSYITTHKIHGSVFYNGIYSCSETYDVNITSDDIAVFNEKIGFVQSYKTDKVSKCIKTGKRIEPKVVSIELIGNEVVYDFNEPNTHWAFVNGLKVHNCGEIGGLPTLTTVCLLGSLNLTQYVEIKDEKPFFDWDQYSKDVQVFARMLDNVCDLSTAPIPSYEWAIKNIRQYGMGVNGLGSALAMLGIPYNSKEAVEFTKRVTKEKENITWSVSALLAKEKGTFPAYNKEKFENTEYFKSDRLEEETKKLIRKHGVRNAKTTTNPPSGTGAIICDNTSNGAEPIFSLEYERKVVRKDWPEGMNQDNVKSILKQHSRKDYTFWEGTYNNEKYYYEPHNRGLCDVKMIRDYGYQWLLDNFPDKDHKKYLVTTKDLGVDDHINIQAIMQYYINQSISKTVNIPKKYPFEEFKNLYLKAWKRGLIGLTTYREGSMESVISIINNKEEGEVIKEDLKLPEEFINGPTTIIKREGMKFYIHFSYLPYDSYMKHPVCMWIYTNTEEKGSSVVCNKASRELAKLALSCGINNKIVQHSIEKCKNDYPYNRLGRMISLCLRHNINRVDILTKLRGIEGDNVSTLLTSVRKFIGKTITDGTPVKGLKCKNVECNSDNLIFEAGCIKCADCGNQECGS